MALSHPQLGLFKTELFKQRELKLKHTAKVYIFGSHFNFLSAFFFFFAKPPQVEGVVLFHLIYVSDKIQEVFLRLSYHLNSNDGLVIGRVVVAAVI